MNGLRLVALLLGGSVLVGGADMLRRALERTSEHTPGLASEHASGAPAPTTNNGSATPAPPAALTPGPQDLESLNAPYDGKLHFVRIQYTPGGRGGFGLGGRRGRGGREPMWAHDYPRAERNFMKIIDETTFTHPLVDGSNILALDDPRLFQYPLAYIVEVGAWEPTDEEAAGLGEYLRKGGFLIVDDFRGEWELQNLAFQMDRALPGAQLMMLDESHEIFDSFFRIDPHEVIPPYDRGTPLWYGVFEDNDRDKRLMAIINYNNDIAEYWEFSDMGYYPIDLSNEAYKLGVNYIIYALTH
jgi:hypothetical protein